MSPARLVIFDVDGTLVDSQDLIVAAQGMAFASCGLLAPPRAEALSIVGLSLREAFATLAGPDAPVDRLAEAYKQAFHALRAQGREEPFFPGAREAVAALASRPDVLLGVATGKSRRGVAAILERAGWEGVFTTIQTADDNPSKPAPDMLLAALRETGMAARDAIMVGDTSFDVLMAKQAGVTPLGVDWGYHPTDALRAAGAAEIAQSFADVLAFVQRSLSREPAHA